ncbi:MAG: SRPBCC domain-containing protein [Myxococcales bacterium]|nr:SRPBCC domain-containing protein [Myxococcales bacterium]
MPTVDAEREGDASVHLVVRRTIAAAPERVFAAWTRPEHLTRWWGPPGVTCPTAEVDLRVGGRYRIANRLPDGALLWITGTYELIDAPRRLVYSWAHEPVDEGTAYSRVTVRFEPRERGTEVIVIHERLADAASRERHRLGWRGCLDGLAAAERDG